MPSDAQKADTSKIDPRIYLGILVFRWKLVVICFLYALLFAVLYLEFVPKKYLTRAAVVIARDPNTQISGQNYLWQEANTHIDLLRSEGFNERIKAQLSGQWAEKVGDPAVLGPPVGIRRIPSGNIALELTIQNEHPAYARAYLNKVVDEFQAEREAVKEFTTKSASKVLEDQLTRLEEKIRAAEDDVIQFQRLNQMEFVQMKGQLELGYLSELLGRQQQLSTEQWLLEVQFPTLKGASAEMIRNVIDLNRETAAKAISPNVRRAIAADGEEAKAGVATAAGAPAEMAEPLVALSPAIAMDTNSLLNFKMDRGWQELRLKLTNLQKEKANLTGKLQPEHPQIRALEEDIRDIQKQLDFFAELEYQRCQERYNAINVELNALDEAQRRWRDSYLMASRKGSDLRHLQAVVARLESMYVQLYNRLNDLRIEEEMKAEHFSVLTPVRTESKPVWPDPLKILLGALMLGVGSGLGLALLMHSFDNKVQSISDVESAVGVPFLGGIPFWVQTEMVGRIRPIVNEEHRSGAAEAYRALRTNVLAALEKVGKKVMLLTSADSKEGKTLTVLNMALMIAKAGKKVLLLDMDLRRGVLHKSMEMERHPGITDVMRRGGSLRDVVRATAYENVWFVPAGTTEKNTSELLHMVDLTALLGEIMGQYDYILMDTAPVLRATDTVVLARVPFCSVIYVAHANRTPKPMIRYSLDMLGDVHVLGMIINSIEMNKISSLYYTYQYPNYAYYSYAYQYGYDYYLYDEQGRKGKRPLHHRRSVKSLQHSIKHWWRRTFMPSE
jgi:capsular exopolysaccharide synthesis family protein